MAHQSGITPSEDLLRIFKEALQTRNIRGIKVSIEGESLVCSDSQPTQGTWIQDFNLISWLEDKVPCFILYRLDSNTPPTPSGNSWSAVECEDPSWIIGFYVPDFAPVRQKMLYASSKATLSKELGDSKFVDYLYGTTKNEFTLEGYKKHREHQNSSAPLTEREKELESVKKLEGLDIGASAKRNMIMPIGGQSGSGLLKFPVEDSATEALNSLKDGDLNLVVLKIDIVQEVVQLDFSDKIDSADQVGSNPKFKSGNGLQEPRYILYRFNGKPVFALTCPGTSKVKERTIYSSTRGSIIGKIDQVLGEQVAIQKKLELDSPTEFNQELLDYEFNQEPAKKSPPMATKFSKPTRPGRGVARVV